MSIFLPPPIPLRLPFAHHRNFNFAKAIRISNPSTALTDYQVKIELNADNFPFSKCRNDGYDVRFLSDNRNILDFWTESWSSTTATIWVKVDEIPSYSEKIIWLLYGNPSASSASNITTTFLFGDEFEGFKDPNPSYLTGWSKSGSNPLKNIGSQGWFAAVYNEYDDKFYLYIQNDSGAGNQFQCFSFLKADAETPANWTAHGNVYTGSELWEDDWIEPHSIIWETQAMADAREDVGEGEGTRKWRIYYCAKPDAGVSQYQTGFAVASESNMTSLSAYSGNPVYPGTSDSIADQKAVVYRSELWMLVGDYNSGCNYAFFTHSSNGIDNWTDCSAHHSCRWLMGTPHVLKGGITIIRDLQQTPDKYHTGFTTDGESIVSYSGNPVLTGASSGWDDGFNWNSVAQTKDGSCLIDSYYYMFYIGVLSGAEKIGLAKTQTVTEEQSVEGVNTNKWTVTGDEVVLNNSRLEITGDDSYSSDWIKGKTAIPRDSMIHSKITISGHNTWFGYGDNYMTAGTSYSWWDDDMDGTWYFRYYLNGASTETDTYTGSGAGTYNIDIWVNSTGATLYQDGVEKAKLTQGNFTDTYIVMGNYKALNTAYFDNVFVRKYASQNIDVTVL